MTELRRLLAAVQESVGRAAGRLDGGDGDGGALRDDLASATDHLARAVELAAPPAVPEPAYAPPVPRGRVLLVDDEALAVDCITEYLDGRGYDVLPAGTPRDALALAARRVIDVVVTDLRMAGMDGVQLVTELRRNRPGLPAVVVTGHLIERVEAGDGPTVIMPKPLALDRLESVVAHLLTARPAETS